MRSDSIVKESFTVARQCMMMALMGAGCVIAALIIERTLFQSDSEDAAQRLVSAHLANNQILLTDERLTFSAYMAAVTGEKRWIDRYRENSPVINHAIEEALKLAPNDIAKAFDKETRASHEELKALEKKSFQALTAGKRDEAQKLLDSPAYSENKTILQKGTQKFIDSMMLKMSDNLSYIHLRSSTVLLWILIAACFGGFLLLRRVNKSLDQTELAFVEAEKEIRYLANNDALTGLTNRFSFQDSLKNTLTGAKEPDHHIAVLMLDLDNFKPVNDRYGHYFGDMVLSEVAKRMRLVLGESANYARYGGDEFIIHFDFQEGRTTPQTISKKLIKSLSEIITINGVPVQIGASVGIATYPIHGTDDQELVRKADVALYSAKQAGRGQYQIYHSSMDDNLDDRTSLEEELREAVANDEIVPFYQPIVCLKTGALEGFEILSRWEHKERGLLTPYHFIDLAEEIGIIGDLTLSVLKQACLQSQQLPADCFLSMNISPKDVQDEWLVEKILKCLNETGFPAHRLEVELTENALVSDFDATRNVIQSFKNIGIKVALDDFGTGYSSLSYLSELPFDKLKIDRSFIQSLDEREEREKIVRTIVLLGQSFDILTVAEGIESEAHQAILKEVGCSLGQGYLYSKPQRLENILEFSARFSETEKLLKSA